MYCFSKSVTMPFEDAVAATKEALRRHNFRVLAEVDLSEAFKKHLTVDFRRYLILGGCVPELAYRALRADDEIGSLLLCNVAIQQKEDGRVEVFAADPTASIGTFNHVELLSVATDLRSLLQRVINELEDQPKLRRILRVREEGGCTLLQVP